MRIGIDVDGVLANFNHAFIERCIAVTGKDLFPTRPFDIPKWDYPQHFGYTESEVKQTWDTIVTDEMFWYTLHPFDGVPEFLSRLNGVEHDIYFITNRPGVNAKSQTESWLEFHNYGLNTEVFGYPTVLLSASKGTCAVALGLDLYIDDKVENCLDVNHLSPKTQTIMLARPWNEEQHGIARLATLDEFAALIQP